MKRTTLIKLLCLAVACLLILPMVFACGEEESSGNTQGSQTTDSSNGGTTGGSNGGTTDGSTNGSNGGTINSGTIDDGVEKVTIAFRFGSQDAATANGEKSVTIQIAKGSKLTAAQCPEVFRADYTLVGWSFNATGTEPWDGTQTFNEDKVLYAIWEKGGTSSSNQGSTNSSNNPGGTDQPTTGDEITITFALRGGTIIDGTATISIKKGSTITSLMAPEAEKTGYTFKCWSYDREGNQQWYEDEPFIVDTILYAQWTEKSSGGTTDSSNQGGTNSSNQGGDVVEPPVVDEKVTVEFDTGSGYFENDSDYEMELDKGSRFPSAFPTPVNDNEAMKFDGWFKDKAFTQLASRSDKYEVDTVLYAKWTEQVKCIDGSYDHLWTAWDIETEPTCTKAGTMAQYCQTCNTKNTMTGDPATGHSWRAWTEGFLRRERTCSVLGCGAEQYQEFENITLSTLGNDPAAQMKLEMAAGWGSNRVTALINNNWDEANSATFCGNSCEVKVTINLLTASTMDRIYVKGHGAGSSFNIYVQYEGDSDYTLVGSGGFLSDSQNADTENRSIPYANVDNTRNIVSVQIVMPNASYGMDYWDEVAFIKIPPVEAE